VKTFFSPRYYLSFFPRRKPILGAEPASRRSLVSGFTSTRGSSQLGDGKSAVHVKFTPVRVVCRNTLNQAMENGPTLRVVHTLSMKARLQDVAQAVKRIDDRFNELGATFRRLAC
jgi:hypothetical protein